MKNKEYWINWAKAAGIRAVKTVAETAISLIGADMVNIVTLDWLNIAGVCATAGVVSILVSLKGLPEVPKWEEVEPEEEAEGDSEDV